MSKTRNKNLGVRMRFGKKNTNQPVGLLSAPPEYDPKTEWLYEKPTGGYEVRKKVEAQWAGVPHWLKCWAVNRSTLRGRFKKMRPHLKNGELVTFKYEPRKAETAADSLALRNAEMKRKRRRERNFNTIANVNPR